MIPTAKLRFVERKSTAWETADIFQTTRTVKVLQQWWEDKNGDLASGITLYGEWRDVPSETSND